MTARRSPFELVQRDRLILFENGDCRHQLGARNPESGAQNPEKELDAWSLESGGMPRGIWGKFMLGLKR